MNADLRSLFQYSLPGWLRYGSSTASILKSNLSPSTRYATRIFGNPLAASPSASKSRLDESSAIGSRGKMSRAIKAAMGKGLLTLLTLPWVRLFPKKIGRSQNHCRKVSCRLLRSNQHFSPKLSLPGSWIFPSGCNVLRNSSLFRLSSRSAPSSAARWASVPKGGPIGSRFRIFGDALLAAPAS
jgi:hypothetical protein